MYQLLKPLLFRQDPEKAHYFTLRNLNRAHALGLTHLMGVRIDDPTECMGLTFPNKVGLAAGLDKDGTCIDAFAALGFGFVEVGTVTPRSQPGNDKPRLFRLPEHQAIINRMGFNNQGVEALVERASKRTWKGPLGINLGKNKDTPNEEANADYLKGLRACYAQADYVAINISSPNTPGLRDLQHIQSLRELLQAVMAERNMLAEKMTRRVPVAVKIAPDLEESDVEAMAQVFVETGVDGVIATNTTLSRDAVKGHRHADEAGGLSGAPVFKKSTQVLGQFVQYLDGALPVIGAGGILNGDQARAKLDAGASLVQIYSGLIYRGPALLKEALRMTASSSSAGQGDPSRPRLGEGG